MQKLLLTTALVSLIAAMPVTAQTATDDTTTTGTMTGTFTPPEVYTAFDATTLTVDDLQGATIYDANGESVGEISDFVLGDGMTGSTGAAAGTGMDASGGVSDTGTTTAPATDPTSGDTTGDSGDTSTGAAGTDPGTDTSTGTDTGTDTGAAGTATDTTSGDTTGDSGDTSTAVTGTTDGTGTMTGTPGEQAVDVSEGRISHVVLDVGGFLGMGVHTVAIPMEALQVFRDGSNDIRVYLPWTQEQLEALPEYDAANPASLDAADKATSGATN